MKLTAKVKLLPTPEQRQFLLQTLETANAACDWMSARAWEKRTFGAFSLHKIVYAEARERFDLSAQMVVRLIAKVGDAYKLDKKSQRTFRPRGAISYDSRILTWRTQKQRVSIWTMAGRTEIPYAAGQRQLELLEHQQGESDLCYIGGQFYLFTTCDIEEPAPIDVEGVLGVDLGIVNIAVTSDGDTHTSETIERNRQRMNRLRAQLQRKGTRSAKRHLKKLRGRQARFQADVNHVISKRIVSCAERTNRAVAIEDLTGIGKRTRVKGKDNRAKRSNWSFFQLRAFLGYKARMIGVPLIAVDPAYTSQRCSECGHTERANRRNQAEFQCVSCGFSGNADHNASLNIAWAAVNPPIVPSILGKSPSQVQAAGLVPAVN